MPNQAWKELATAKRKDGPKPSDIGRRGAGGKLRSKPIMIYPSEPDVRTKLALLAELEGMSLSQFIFAQAEKSIEKKAGRFKNFDAMFRKFRENELKGGSGKSAGGMMVGVPSPIPA